MKIFLFGGTGFIGSSFADHLAERGHLPVQIARNRPTQSRHQFLEWDGRTLGPWAEELVTADAIVNLAGRSVDCIKTPDNIDVILRSRVDSCRVIGEALARLETKPPVWVQMSTGHIYGDSELLLTEDDHFGHGLAPFVGRAWEKSLLDHLPNGMREVRLRTSFVVGKGGGALASLSQIVKLGLGGTVGNGRQGMSWIHEDDMNELMLRSITDETMEGAYIATAPNPVTNKEFMGLLRRALKVPIGLPAPAFAVRIGAKLLFRTDPDLALYGRYLRSRRLAEEGFEFKFPQLREALADLCD
ncbi:epimerase [Lewinella sp. 4G2]|uniref:epimerase n=1 Tax=Lewinella sp. 4G2 TaxID=1803372 RepID=UPI0007B4DD50|nr:DUF1731 domain-containing protein [Lewinella sp. 4G2]OAV44693.1 epimerase [Lewinella sp. 4G2]